MNFIVLGNGRLYDPSREQLPKLLTHPKAKYIFIRVVVLQTE